MTKIKRIIIFGNSGSGKSTMAIKLKEQFGITHLDLDSLAWQKESPPNRQPIAVSEQQIKLFLKQNKQWVIEGGYSDLLRLVYAMAEEVIFLNPGVDQCIENCNKRPWESHKYPSVELQNANLPMLRDWVREYYSRRDEFSFYAHTKLFSEFIGDKIEVT